MEALESIIRFVDTNLIHSLVPMILTLMLVQWLFTTKLPTQKVLNLICWVILTYAVLSLISSLLDAMSPEEGGQRNVSRGVVHWILFFTATILPFTLLIKRLATKYWYVLLVAFLMKIGVYLEQFVIVSTSLARDYGTENWDSETLNLWVYGKLMAAAQGVLLALLLLGLFKLNLFNNYDQRRKNQS